MCQVAYDMSGDLVGQTWKRPIYMKLKEPLGRELVVREERIWHEELAKQKTLVTGGVG